MMLACTFPFDRKFTCTLSEEDKQTLLRIWNEGEWGDELIECMPDYEITWEGYTMRYRSCCGIFTRVTEEGWPYMTTSPSDRETVERMMERYAQEYNTAG